MGVFFKITENWYGIYEDRDGLFINQIYIDAHFMENCIICGKAKAYPFLRKKIGSHTTEKLEKVSNI